MHRLDILRVVVSPGSAHPFGINVVWDDISIVRKLLMADCTLFILFGDLAIEQFPHFSIGAKLTVSTWMVGIVDTLYADLSSFLNFCLWLPSTTE